MSHPDRHLVYVLGHPEAWRLLSVLERGPRDRYEQVRKRLGMHSQAFQRLLYWMRGYGLVRVRARPGGRAPRGVVAVHLEISPKGRAMLALLERVEKEVQGRRAALGVRNAGFLAELDRRERGSFVPLEKVRRRRSASGRTTVGRGNRSDGPPGHSSRGDCFLATQRR